MNPTHSAFVAVALDLDGTLMTSRQTLSARNRAAIRAVLARGLPVIIATGKTRHAAETIIADLQLTTPGVYVQGLVLTDGNGEIFYQRHLEPEMVGRLADFAAPYGCAVIAYSGNRLLTPTPGPLAEQFTFYHEPAPLHVADLHREAINKILLVRDAPTINGLRGALELAVGEGATVVQALPNMIEIVPSGASKGDGLRRVLERLAVDPARTLAIGDGENDIEMLQLVGVGVAMGNAGVDVKRAADVVTATNDADGVALALERYILER